MGTTSACAENTVLHHITSFSNRNYLRVRGEYWRSARRKSRIVELPPRARRIPILRGNLKSIFGTTSACAENTVFLGRIFEGQWNYLRVRGEY